MKPILATIALLLAVGCASKPKPKLIKQPTSVLLPSSVEGVGDERTYVPFEYDEAIHVTRAQWEAAQELYNPHHFFMKFGDVWVWEYCGPETSPCDPVADTFPPLGSAR